MKKFASLLLGALAAFGLGSCSDDTTAMAPAPEKGKTLVVYFSYSGNTKAVAEKMAKGLDADLFEIVPEQPYTEDDVNYKNQDCRSSVEARSPEVRPAIKGKVEDISKYDVVCIGYPVWYGEAPNVVYTFVESHDLSGKTVVPFCTSGSGGMAQSADHLVKAVSGAKCTKGERLYTKDTEEDLRTWALKQIGSAK